MYLLKNLTRGNIKKHNPNWPQILDHPYWMLIIRGSGSGKINALFNLISYQPHIDKTYLCAKDPNETKYQLLIKKWESKNRMIWMIFIKILKNTIQIRNAKHWSYFMIWLLICLIIKHLINPVVTEIFFGGRKLNISLAFIAKSYFPEPKNIRIDFTNYFIMKIPNRKVLQQIPFNHSSSINYRDLINL